MDIVITSVSRMCGEENGVASKRKNKLAFK